MISRAAIRALSRFELRQLRRHRARSWLVVLLIAVPVAAVVGGGALLKISRPTLDEVRAKTLGAAKARVILAGDADADEPAASWQEELPPDARVEPFHSAQITLHVPGRRIGAKYLGLAPESLEEGGLARGLIAVTSGRAPERMDEVALSPSVLRALDLSAEDRVRLDPGTERRIVGVVVDPEDLDMAVVLSPNAPSRPYGTRSFLIGTSHASRPADGWVITARAAGSEVLFREELGQVDGFVDATIFVVGGLGFVEAALIIAAAFAVGFRRRQREIGLLGSVGATRLGLILSMLSSSVVLALLGGVLGASVGVGVAAALFPGLDSWTGRWNGPFEVSVMHVAGAFVLAIGTAVVASAAPAWSATSLPIRVALSARRPVRRDAARWHWSGLMMGSVGVALVAGGAGFTEFAPLATLSGGVLIVIGLCVVCPAILQWMTRFAAPLPLAWRLAIRDVGRFRTQNGPVVAAVLAGMAISLLLAGLIQSVERMVDQRAPAFRADQLLVAGPGAEPVATELQRETPGAVCAPLLAVHLAGASLFLPAEPSGSAASRSFVACGDEALLRALGAEAGLAAFREGALIEMVSMEDASVARAGGEDAIVDPTAGPGPSGLALPGVEMVQVLVTEPVRGPRYLISTSALPALSMHSGPPPSHELVPWLVRFDERITSERLEHARARAEAVGGTSVDAEIARARPTRTLFGVVLLISFVTSLIVIAIATALSAVESATDRRVLHAVGAAPSLLRRHLAARAGYLAFLGCALAVPAGCLPLLGLLPLSGGALRFVMPWREVLIAIVGFPLTAYGATWMYAWASGPRRGRVSRAPG